MVDVKKRENAEGSLPSILGDPGAVSRVRRKVGSNVLRGCLPSFPLPIVPLPFFPLYPASLRHFTFCASFALGWVVQRG